MRECLFDIDKPYPDSCVRIEMLAQKAGDVAPLTWRAILQDNLPSRLS